MTSFTVDSIMSTSRSISRQSLPPISTIREVGMFVALDCNSQDTDLKYANHGTTSTNLSCSNKTSHRHTSNFTVDEILNKHVKDFNIVTDQGNRRSTDPGNSFETTNRQNAFGISDNPSKSSAFGDTRRCLYLNSSSMSFPFPLRPSFSRPHSPPTQPEVDRLVGSGVLYQSPSSLDVPGKVAESKFDWMHDPMRRPPCEFN